MSRSALPAAPPAPGFIVHVDMAALARNLADRYAGRWDERAAARWLIQSVDLEGVEQKSPFVQTDDFGVFFSAEDPAAWLEPDELLAVGPADKRHKHPYA